jgi:GT2 family glycosyltransferase
VVVDDGSSDATPETLAPFAATGSIRVIRHHERRGANAARNTGLPAASGDWVAFADADAVYRPDWIAKLLAAGADDSNVGVVYSGFTRRFDCGTTHPFASRAWSPTALWSENYIAMPSLVRREALPDTGLDETTDLFDDWELWLDLARRGWSGKLVRANLFTAMVREDGKTRKFQRDPVTSAAVVAGFRRRYASLVGIEGSIAVVIPACGGEQDTVRCLEHLALFCGLPFQVFYVDNGSLEKTVAAVATAAERYQIPLTILRNATNEGFTAAVNRGIRAAGYRHVLVLNNDCFIAPNCVERLWWTLQTKPRCAAAGPLSNDRGAQSIVRGNTATSVGANPAIRSCADDPVAAGALLNQSHRSKPAPMLAFFCTLLHRDAIRDVGLLDERFLSGLGADDEWCYRARCAGWDCRLTFNAYAVHLHSATFLRLGLDYSALHREAMTTLRQATIPQGR